MKDKYFRLSDDFKTIIKNTMPDKTVEKITLIPTGWTNIVYEVETNKGNYFFRFPRDEFWSRTIVKDCEFAKYIYGKTDFNTIKLELCYDNERPFSMHKKIEGTPLAEKMSVLDIGEIRKVCGGVAKFMYQLHTLNYTRNEIFNTDNIGLNLSEFLDELLNVHIDKENRKFWSILPIDNATKCLVHGDLNSSNILLDDNNNISAIIDFGFAGFGNEYDDIARIIGRCPNNFKEDIVKSYELYSRFDLDRKKLDRNIETWNNIDNAYIGYMRKIGIYE